CSSSGCGPARERRAQRRRAWRRLRRGSRRSGQTDNACVHYLTLPRPAASQGAYRVKSRSAYSARLRGVDSAKVFHVPSEDCPRFPLGRASKYYRVVDRAARETKFCGFLDSIEIFVLIEGYDSEPFPRLVDEQDRLFRRYRGSDGQS